MLYAEPSVSSRIGSTNFKINGAPLDERTNHSAEYQDAVKEIAAQVLGASAAVLLFRWLLSEPISAENGASR
jgi:hypothetical protein